MLIQRVTQAQVEVDGQVTDQIGNGLLVLLGVEHDDTTEDASWLAQKVVSMRIFSDDADKMNRDIREVGGEILLVSQFTLHAACPSNAPFPVVLNQVESQDMNTSTSIRDSEISPTAIAVSRYLEQRFSP